MAIRGRGKLPIALAEGKNVLADEVLVVSPFPRPSPIGFGTSGERPVLLAGLRQEVRGRGGEREIDGIDPSLE